MTARQPRLACDSFRLFRQIPTRWSDNDVFAHVNNFVYYSWFDTAVTGWLLENGHLDASKSPVVPLVVETTCTYFESVAFPETVAVGLAVERLGSSSVTYRLGIFRRGGELAAAQGRFTHVYVERATQKPVPIPDAMRAALTALGG
jgi:acyl-CoA thioester hydrolase